MTHDIWHAAVEAFNQQEYHLCHELLEPLWKAAPPASRPYYQGLIQVACAYHHLGQGKLGPASRLFRRGLDKLAPLERSELWAEPLGRMRTSWRVLLTESDAAKAVNLASRLAPRLPEGLASVEEAIMRLYNTSGGTPMLITRRFRFSAAHRYHDDSLSLEENQRLFGKCSGAHGHGHNYVLDVSVRGKIDPKTGMIVNLKDLKEVVNARVIERYDFKHLNFDVEDFHGTQPTCEQIAVKVWNLLEGKIPGCELARVRLYESDELFAEYEGG